MRVQIRMEWKKRIADEPDIWAELLQQMNHGSVTSIHWRSNKATRGIRQSRWAKLTGIYATIFF